MQANSLYQFVVQLFAEGDAVRPVGQLAIAGDGWTAALESTRWAAVLRDGGRDPIMPCGAATIEPVWNSAEGEPFVSGFRCTLADAGRPIASDFTADYFADAAQQLTLTLQSSGQLAGGSYQYVVCAFPKPEPSPTAAPRWSVEPREQPLRLELAPLSDLINRSEPYGPLSEEDMPVFVPAQLLDEAVALHEQAGAAETGGNLIGQLCRDRRQPERIFVLLTAQIPARHAQQELTRLTFTPETWSDVDGVLRLRGGRERKLGWWHSHPARRWCEKCPVENRKVCKLSGDFFSTHDSALHRAAYPMAFTVALVVSDSFAEGLTFPMFGWRGGLLVRRGFYRLNQQQIPAELM